MAQFARPDSDIATLFTPTPSGTHFSTVDEVVADDGDFVTGGEATSDRYGLSAVTDPEVSTGHFLRWRAQATGSGGPEKMHVRLFQSTTEIAQNLNITISRGSFNDYSLTLSASQADAITDYAALEILLVTGNGVAGSDTIDVSWFAFEVPDAPAGGGEETASVSPVTVPISLPTVTATYQAQLSASVVPVTTPINLTAVTASYIAELTASVAPVAVPISLPTVTAEATSSQTASVSPVQVAVVLPTVTASYLAELAASVAPVVTPVSTPAVTASYQAEIAASVAPITIPIQLPTVTASGGGAETASVAPTILTISLPTVTASDGSPPAGPVTETEGLRFGGVAIGGFSDDAGEDDGLEEMREFWRNYHEMVQEISNASARRHDILDRELTPEEIEADDLEVLSLL